MSRSPARGGGIILSIVLVPVTCCGGPSLAGELYTMIVNFNAPEFLRFVLPALVGWPAAWLSWRAARRAGTPRHAWLLVGLTAVLLVAPTVEPVRLAVHLMHDEWRETQPGGRGYQGPS